MIRTTVRTSNRDRWCNDCGRPIRSGVRYLEHVASPWHGDLNNPRWLRMAECSLCAQGYGRWPTLYFDGAEFQTRVEIIDG